MLILVNSYFYIVFAFYYGLNTKDKSIPSDTQTRLKNIQRHGIYLNIKITYAQIEVGGVIKKTMADAKGGKKPTWNETFEFKTSSTLVKISVYDQGNFAN